MNDTALPSELAPLNDASTALATPTPAPTPIDPWEALSAAPDSSATSAWLDAPAPLDGAHQLAGNADAAGGLQLHRLWDGSLPVESWINSGLGWVVEHFRPFFQTVRLPIDGTLNWIQGLLTGLPTLAMIALIGLLAWQFAGRALAIGTTVALLLVAMLGIWPEAMVTLSLVLTSLVLDRKSTRLNSSH